MVPSGLDNAGKTTIVKQAMREDISQVSPTLGFNIKTLIYKGYSLHICTTMLCGKRLWSAKLCILLFKGDVGGQRSLRPYWRNHFEDTDALIWVVDSNDHLSWKDCRQELFSLLQEEVSFDLVLRFSWLTDRVYAKSQRLAGASLLVFANKQDVPEAPSQAEIEQVGNGWWTFSASSLHTVSADSRSFFHEISRLAYTDL